jgi:hypothetical protein
MRSIIEDVSEAIVFLLRQTITPNGGWRVSNAVVGESAIWLTKSYDAYNLPQRHDF